jgi:GTP cyclohydrolase I
MPLLDRSASLDRTMSVDPSALEREHAPASRVAIRGRPRRAGKPDLPRMAAAVRELLLALGEDPEREGLLDTPMRVARSFAEQNAGLRDDPAKHLGRVFNSPYDGVVQVRGIDFHGLCEHHLLPIIGKVHIAYLPRDGKVVGISKLARLVDVYAHRPQVQERMTAEIVQALERHLDPRGIVVRVEAEHLCMKVRGVKRPCASTLTVLRRGVFASEPERWPELVELLKA